ncbi:MAG: nitrogen regulation protein NR(II) [Burkholderiales bacterium]|nr:nitrogen regulation protein NR(II) [Burkholderiales bacterium]
MTAQAAFAGLDLLATAVIALDADFTVCFVNTAAELLFSLSSKAARGQRLAKLFAEGAELEARLRTARAESAGFWEQAATLTPIGQEPVGVNVLASPVEADGVAALVEVRPIEKRLRVEREEQLASASQASRELIRNLAHEIKNPLGGLRGSAQLLERELADRPELREYTQVIIKEADRLQVLMDRLLTPSRLPRMGPVNIHEVCERVRSLVLAEFPEGIVIRRDYDTSLPDLTGDREQLIQVVLNVVRNAAQALAGAPAHLRPVRPEITLRTRVVRQATLHRRRYPLALELAVVDNGPGVPEAIAGRIFNPLVSGRDGGSGLGLTIAQTYVQHHHGVLECESQPGRTVFRVVLPIGANGSGGDKP